MKTFTIRTNKTTSKQSNEVNNRLDVNLTNTSKLSTLSDYSEIIDAYRVFEEERAISDKFRFIFTINPYCSNVLFNAVTEVVKDEGSTNPIVIAGNKSASANNAIGNSNPLRWEMIMNTEYSTPTLNYSYLPGYDIYTNHIIRNKGFKMVNNASPNGNSETYFDGTIKTEKYVFNTIGDQLRYADKSVVKYYKRTRIPDSTTYTDRNLHKKHLYEHIDLMSYEESILNNLTEDNGWVGFTNNSSIDGKKYNVGEDKGTDMKISKIINNREGCEFIDMYPDRTLFSFNPKYNDFKNRFEYNWDVCITYPYSNYTNHELVKGGRMKVLSCSVELGINGGYIMMLRTYVKHGLKQNDSFKLYIDNNNDEDLTFIVKNIGDIKNEKQDYYFYTTDTTLIERICGEDFENDDIATIKSKFQNGLKGKEIRYTRIVKNCESEYYFRVFRKLPNLKKAHVALTDEIAKDNILLYGDENTEIGGYVGNNAIKDNHTLLFDKEYYRLAFARTIYNDLNTQVTYTDTIDVEHFRDNRNRPLTKLYFTIIKRNKGYDEWYNKKNYTSEEIEYSRCFGKVTSGVEMSVEEYDDVNVKKDKAKLGDVRILNNINKGGNNLFLSHPIEEEITLDGSEIGIDCFLGDIVEYNLKEVAEHTLAWVNHRFNTMQRELTSEDYNDFYYQEITGDDYDLGNFTITNTKAEGWTCGDNTKLESWQRPEGYFYKPHYEIAIKEFGNIQQSSHYTLNIEKDENGDLPQPDKAVERLYVTTLSRADVTVGDTMMLTTADDSLYYGVVFDVYSNYTFSIVLDPAKTDKKITEIGKITDIRRLNDEIPDYADNIKGTTAFLWRDVLRSGDNGIVNLPEYTFSNGAFYIHSGINFFLRRQDPDGWIGLQCYNAFPNDISGNLRGESIYEYKDETFIVC